MQQSTLNSTPVAPEHSDHLRRDFSEMSERKPSFFHRFLFARPPVLVVFIIAIFLLASVLYLDKNTGPFAISYFYAMPVLLMAWYLGRKAGFLMMVITMLTWYSADRLGYSGVTLPLKYAIANAITRVVLLSIAVLILCAFKDLNTQLEKMVEERTKSLRRLATQLSEAEDIQRRRLAHDIHDGFSQMLSALKLSLAASLSESRQDSPQWNRIKSSIDIVSDLINNARTLTFDLHPAMLEHLGLTPTLRHHAKQFTQQTGIDVTINEEDVSQSLPPVITNYIFRAVKELLNNSAKHGHAKQIIVSLYWSPTSLRIVVDDDGSGFEPGVVLAPDVTRGLGLASIQERLGSFGGNVRIESNTQTGTRAVLEVPVTQEQHA